MPRREDNAVEMGSGDSGDGLGMLGAFRKALQDTISKGNPARQEMGLYGVAMAAGRPVLGGFAPVAGVAGRPVSRKSGVVVPVGEPGSTAVGHAGVRADGGTPAARRGAGADTSWQAVVSQARHQAAAGQVRREVERAGLRLPASGAAAAGMSFAPALGRAAADGVSLYPAARNAPVVPGLRRGGSVHGAVAAAEAAPPTQEGAADQPPATMRQPVLEAGAEFDIRRALEAYFFQQSRLPPAGAAGFNPSLSPVWAGLKIPS